MSTVDAIHSSPRAEEVQRAADVFASGRYVDAAALAQSLTKRFPHHSFGWKLLGSAYGQMGRYADAITPLRTAAAIYPEDAEAHSNLGVSLGDIGQFDEAVECFRRALKIKPDYADAHNNLGWLLCKFGRLDESLSNLRRALEIDPGFNLAAFNLGYALLSNGSYVEGWPHYELRSMVRASELTNAASRLPFPQWRGESLRGKSLLLWPEQGFGDYVQLARYAPLLKERGVSRLTFICQSALKGLLATVDGIDDVIDAGNIPPYDYWSFPLSLPFHCGTTVETIPASLPYLRALPERREHWRQRLPRGFNVGLVWKGASGHANDGSRSLPGLSTLTRLWGIPGVNFVSLQKSAGEDDARTAGLPLTHLGSDIADFADTAAIVDQLDLVICVDTAVAHVAGALGKPCWVMLPAIGCDWRWMRDRSDSPWYPGALRLFRQKKPGEWSGVVDELVSALSEFVASRSPKIPG
ncbi:hypothetical protein QF001_000949 [Paraburkholderia youngii]|uniref:tetratricopeptide repeat-containing glycosyltransferase family protein n=1 Tax=Paraburkholderia youngii TaxID=2782701 RepID=UPI003D1C8F7E